MAFLKPVLKSNSILRFLTKNAYRREMVMIILLKLTLLFLLAHFCFSHPTSKELTSIKLASHWLA